MNEHHQQPATTKATTTHAAWGAGSPRLRVKHGDDRFEFDLVDDLVRIGSDAANELTLEGTDPLHATITHDERDEYVLTMHGEGNTNARLDSAGKHPDPHSETLRNGASFTAGDWELVFARDEFADHGRPYGGREGGELSDQEPQPPRPDYPEADAAT